MSTWNMPPGVTTNDIPGNEPDKLEAYSDKKKRGCPTCDGVDARSCMRCRGNTRLCDWYNTETGWAHYRELNHDERLAIGERERVMSKREITAGMTVSTAQGRNMKDEYCLQVMVGGGARHFIPNPASDPHLEWTLLYGPDDDKRNSARLAAVSVLCGFDYLISENITMAEATRRLRLLRAARRAALTPNAGLSGGEAVRLKP